MSDNTTWSFSLTLSPIGSKFDSEEDWLTEIADWLYEAGCDDATFCVSNGVWTLSFDREAATLVEAVESAKASVARAGLTVLRCDLLESEP